MLQKYHANPLSQLLALHNTQTTGGYGHVHAHNLAATVVGGHYPFQQPQPQSQIQPQYHHHHQQQQQHTATTFNQLQQQEATHHQQFSQNYPNAQYMMNTTQLHDNNNITNRKLNSPADIISNHHNHHHNYHYNNYNYQNHNDHNDHNDHNHKKQQLIDDETTVSLDQGKSFTIAAILGLQKSAINTTPRDFKCDVINLSLNAGGDNNNNCSSSRSSSNSNSISTNNSPDNRSNFINSCKDDDDDDELKSHVNNGQQQNGEEDSIIIVNGGGSNSMNCNHLPESPANTFNCDSASNDDGANSGAMQIMQRYLPSDIISTAAGTVTVEAEAEAEAQAEAKVTPTATVTATSLVHQRHDQQHKRTNTFMTAAAVAAAAAAAAAVTVSHHGPPPPSALQSLQQLHQQHAHQVNLNFHREKLKSEMNLKKSSLKNKRVRTIFTPEQLERLEAEFERQQYMVGPERLYLAHTLQLTEAQVKVWFQNRRIKWRKHHLELTQQRLALLRHTQLANSTQTNMSTTTAAATNANANTNEIMNGIMNVQQNCNDGEQMNIQVRDDMRNLNESQHDSESELSICNDSIDGESIMDGGDESNT